MYNEKHYTSPPTQKTTLKKNLKKKLNTLKKS